MGQGGKIRRHQAGVKVAREIRHCERSEAIQTSPGRLDCFVATLLAMTANVYSNFMSMHFETSPTLSPELMMMQPRTLRAVLSLAHIA